MACSHLPILFVAALLVNFAKAIDYPGGWTPDKQQCVDICPKTANGLKKNRPGDWDYALIEQMFLPQYCRELDRGVDITLSHQNVQPYPNGIRCTGNVPTEFTIHGLWFDYYDGFPACCNYTDNNENVPFDPIQLLNGFPDLLPQMQKVWYDPAVQGPDSLCVLYNHEFQKHGACYSGAFETDPIMAAHSYFVKAMDVANYVSNATSRLNIMAQHQTPVSVQQIEALYSKKVQIMCSNTQPANQFATIHTCWNKGNGVYVGNQMDCPPAKASALFVPCARNSNITMLKYTTPHANVINV